MELTLLITVLIAHFIADFVMQSDSMAKGKSTSNYWLAIHVLVYTAIIGNLILLVASPTGALIWALINGVAHFIVDYFTSRWSSSLWKQGRVHDFFVVIGLDQCIHTITLLTTAYWLL